MKTTIQILILFLILSCGDSQTETTEVVSIDSTEKKVLKTSTGVESLQDSFYVEYWCSLDILKRTSESLDKLALTTVTEFLATFHADCADDVEYSEWSNELLFEVASRHSGFLLQLLHENSSLDKALIKKEFESPIHDRFDLDDIIGKMEKIDSPMEIKNEIIGALKIAKSKS